MCPKWKQSNDLEALFEELPIGVFLWELTYPADDRSLRLAGANRAACAIAGLAPDESSGIAIDQCLPGLRLLGYPQKIAAAVLSGQPLPPETIRVEDGTGGERFYKIWAHPLARQRVAVFFEDVTEAKRGESSLDELNRTLSREVEVRRHAEKRISGIASEWAATFDAMSDFVALIDRDFRLRRVNLSLAAFLGCAPSDLVGKRCFEVFHGTDAPWPSCPGRRAMAEGGTSTEEIEDPRIGVPLQVTCSPHFAKDGELIGVVHVARDISAEKAARDEKETLIAQLQQALASVRMLQGLLPICSFCKKIRDDQGYWRQIETYIHEHSEAQFSHGLCPECIRKHYPDYEP